MSKHKILIVDNSAKMRKNIKGLLEIGGIHITEASDTDAGFTLALNEGFDLIITDNNIPEMDGLSFCRKLKINQSTRGIPVIMLGVSETDEEINRGFVSGAAAYISKENIKGSLHKTVSEVLHKSLFRRERLVMVVDDSAMVCKLVETGLTEAGFQVVTAENGKKALNLLKRYRPDLIISDIDMPEMNGFAFCEAIHKDPELATIPFIVMSANSTRSHMNRMLQRGAEAYIVKPFNTDQLVILVEKLLSDQFLLLLKEKERLDAERNIMLASITSLVAALEARDKYTRGHSDAVSDIVSGMAEIAGVGKEDIELIKIGTKLHDIGKIGVRDLILLKPSNLNPEEFEHIKRHPLIGATILRPIESLSSIIPIIKSHHERFDGKGYPHAIKGEEIHLWARMTAVADTYHALTSNRPYRPGMQKGKALEIIDDIKGTQLCPDCVELFLRWVSKQY
ncbi:MAG: response regulator [Desulfobacterales bacterium]|nr:response regulator [Desulfobacterales bacterium]